MLLHDRETLVPERTAALDAAELALERLIEFDQTLVGPLYDGGGIRGREGGAERAEGVEGKGEGDE